MKRKNETDSDLGSNKRQKQTTVSDSFIANVMEEATKLFIEGKETDLDMKEELLKRNPKLSNIYKVPENGGYISVKDEPFIGNRTRIPGTGCIASEGPKDQTVLSFIHDLLKNPKRMNLLTLVSLIFSAEDEKQQRILQADIPHLLAESSTLSSEDKDAVKNIVVQTFKNNNPEEKKKALKLISNIIGEHLELSTKPAISQVVAFGSKLAVGQNVVKGADFTDYISGTLGAIENEIVSIRIENFRGEIEHAKSDRGTYNVVNKGEDFDCIVPVSPVLFSQLVVQDKINETEERINITWFNLLDNCPINLKTNCMNSYLDDAAKQKQYDELTQALWNLYVQYKKDNILVHCKSGVGRTGHLILTWMIMEHYDEIFAEEKIDIAVEKIHLLLNRLREVRPGLVLTKEQFTDAIYNADLLHKLALAKGYYNELKSEEKRLTPVFPRPSLLAQFTQTQAQPQPQPLTVDKFHKDLSKRQINAIMEFDEELNKAEFFQLDDPQMKTQIIRQFITLNDSLLHECTQNLGAIELPNWDIHNKASMTGLKDYLANMNQNIIATLASRIPYDKDEEPIELNDSEFESISQTPADKYGTSPILHSISYLVARYVSKTLFNTLAWTATTAENITQEEQTIKDKFYKILDILFDNNLQEAASYFISKAPNPEEGDLWLAEKMSAQEQAFDQPQTDTYNNALMLSQAEDQARADRMRQECESQLFLQFVILSAIRGVSIIKVFEQILDGKQEVQFETDQNPQLHLLTRFYREKNTILASDRYDLSSFEDATKFKAEELDELQCLAFYANKTLDEVCLSMGRPNDDLLYQIALYKNLDLILPHFKKFNSKDKESKRISARITTYSEEELARRNTRFLAQQNALLNQTEVRKTDNSDEYIDSLLKSFQKFGLIEAYFYEHFDAKAKDELRTLAKLLEKPIDKSLDLVLAADPDPAVVAIIIDNELNKLITNAHIKLLFLADLPANNYYLLEQFGNNEIIDLRKLAEDMKLSIQGTLINLFNQEYYTCLKKADYKSLMAIFPNQTNNPHKDEAKNLQENDPEYVDYDDQPILSDRPYYPSGSEEEEEGSLLTEAEMIVDDESFQEENNVDNPIVDDAEIVPEAAANAIGNQRNLFFRTANDSENELQQPGNTPPHTP